MAQRTTHDPSCPAALVSEAKCICDVLESAAIARASRPSPAELIRQARNKGLIKGTSFAYN